MIKKLFLSTLFYLQILAMEKEQISHQTLLHAIEKNDFNLIKQALDSKVDVNKIIKKRDGDLTTLLHHAATHNKCGIIKILVDHKADLNRIPKSSLRAEGLFSVPDAFEITPLMATLRGIRFFPSYEAVKLLLRLGAHLNPEGDNIDSHLEDIILDKPALTQLILAAGANPNGQCMFWHSFPINRAENNRVVKLLLAYNADLSLTNAKGKTIFVDTFHKQESRPHQSKRFKLMINLIASTEKVLHKHLTGSKPIQKLILDYLYCDNSCSFLSDKISYDFEAMSQFETVDLSVAELTKNIIKSNIEAVKEMLAKNQELIHSCDVSKRTPLHWATIMNDSAMVKLLANSDIVDKQDDLGTTALHNAQEPEIFQLLLTNGADISVTDVNDDTIFEFIECLKPGSKRKKIHDIIKKHVELVVEQIPQLVIANTSFCLPIARIIAKYVIDIIDGEINFGNLKPRRKIINFNHC